MFVISGKFRGIAERANNKGTLNRYAVVEDNFQITQIKIPETVSINQFKDYKEFQDIEIPVSISAFKDNFYCQMMA